MIKESIKKVILGKHLTFEEASQTMDTILRGEATAAQIACFITALRIKGETPDEISGFAIKMREHSVHIFPKRSPLVDTCGTGGDLSSSFNISTVSAFVAAGAGVAIAKHGNRSVSSKCGSADLLEAVGVNINMPAKKVEECINEIGIGFIFAPNFHPAMKYAAPVRKEIGIRTVFNILGPLTNPSGAPNQVIGVYDHNLTEVMAQALKNLGTKHAFIVSGMDGLDEISISDDTKISELKDGQIKTYYIRPDDFGINKAPKEALISASLESNKEILHSVLEDSANEAQKNAVLINSAAAIVVAGKAENIKEGIELAKTSIKQGSAREKLEELIKFTREENP